MSLSSDSAVLTMPVQPANTNGGNGFGFGNDGNFRGFLECSAPELILQTRAPGQ